MGDADGRFELKKVAAGSYQVFIHAAGYATRTAGYVSVQGNTFKKFTLKMLPTIEQSGVVVDTKGTAVVGAKVRMDTMITIDGKGYSSARDKEILTDSDGKFTITDIPKGQARITVWIDGLYQINSMKKYDFPDKNLKLTMTATGSVKITVVDKNGKPVTTGDVSIWDQRGEKVGTWGGGANLHEDGTFTFENVPPGKYFVSADPGSKYNKNQGATPIEIKVGQPLEVELRK